MYSVGLIVINNSERTLSRCATKLIQDVLHNWTDVDVVGFESLGSRFSCKQRASVKDVGTVERL